MPGSVKARIIRRTKTMECEMVMRMGRVISWLKLKVYETKVRVSKSVRRILISANVSR